MLALLPVDRDYLTPAGTAGMEIEEAAYNICVMGEAVSDLRISVDAGPDREIGVYRFEAGWVRVAGQRRDAGRIVIDGSEPGIYAVGRGRPDLTLSFFVSEAAPNPFRERCTFTVGAPGTAGAVGVSIYDVRGRLVRVLHAAPVDGTARFAWDGTDRSGRPVASGIYFIRARTGPTVVTRKAIRVR